MSFIAIKHRRDTAANWTANNPVLLDGQFGIETDTYTDSGGFRYYLIKLGNGVTAWASLPYMRLSAIGGGGGASAFVDLTDVPNSYTGQAGKYLKVTELENGVEFEVIEAADLPTGIDAAKIGDGSVSNTEFQTLNGATAPFTTGEQTKLSNITITQAVNLDTLEIDSHTHSNKAILDATTASFLTADEAKLDNITITQAVNLDTLENDSHTHSNKATLDAITAAFTTADETKLDGIEALADVTDAGNVGTSIHGSTAKNTPIDADTLPLIDSAAGNILKKVTWANIKATLKAYFDTLYAAAGSYLTDSNIVQTITNGVTTNAPSEDAVFDALSGKQTTLVSGTNIKTINSTSILGSGDIVISGGGGFDPATACLIRPLYLPPRGLNGL